jgi:DNA-binding SARP family transcriptional activator
MHPLRIVYNEDVTRLTLRLLGAPQFTLNGEPITKFGSINAQGILIYLALQAERPVSREVLAARFWPEEPDSRARANLRQTLHQLRKLLGDTNQEGDPFLLITRYDVQLNPQSDTLVDVQQFRAAIETHDLQTAVSLYSGDLLPGFSTGSIEFEAWLRQERESLHTLALAAMHELAQDLLQAGLLKEAGAIARRQINLEPWRETAHRQLMQAYALDGDRANALAQFELCRKSLRTELGIEPSPETAALHEEISSGRYGPRGSSRDIKPPRERKHNLPAQTSPLIGREIELAQINKLFREYGERLVTIVGPGGMGKSRLALAAGYEYAIDTPMVFI